MTDIPILPGVNLLFQRQRGRVGKKRKRDTESEVKFSNLKMSLEKHQRFDLNIKDVLNPDKSEIESLSKSYLVENSSELKHVLLTGSNLLFFGFGCKRNFLRTFVAKNLSGEDVLEIDGSSQASSNNNRLLRDLLTAIWEKVLHLSESDAVFLSTLSFAKAVVVLVNRHYGRALPKPTHDQAQLIDQVGLEDVQFDKRRSKREAATSSLVSKRIGTVLSGQANPDWGGRYAHAQAKLYILVHEIGAEALTSPESQESLRILASCESISLIASAEHLQTPLLWRPEMLQDLRWVYLHFPTYVNKPIVPLPATSSASTGSSIGAGEGFRWAAKRSPFVLDGSGSDAKADGSAVDQVLASVTRKHKDIFVMLCNMITQRNQTEVQEKVSGRGRKKGSENSSVTVVEVAMKCKNKMLCRSTEELVVILKEFVDHKLILLDSKEENVSLNLSTDEISRHANCS